MGLNIQQQEINAKKNRNHNIIVPASAGTGKTTTLTARIIDYIKEGNDIENYLVVSFTEAAANELKDRISKNLKENIDDKNEKHFKTQIAKLPMANISTIHSFCLDVIKRYGYVKNIDPAIAGKLGNDGILKQLQDKAISKALEHHKNNDLIYLMNDRSEDISNIEDVIRDIDSFVSNLEDYDGWKKKLFESYDAYEKSDWDKYPIDLKEYLNKKIDRLDESFDIQKDIIIRQTKSKTSANVTNFKNIEPEIKKLVSDAKKCVEKKDFKSLGKLFIDFPGLPPATGFRPKAEGEIRKYEKDVIFDKIVEELRTYYCFEESINSNYQNIKTLLEISENYRKYYDEFKRQQDIIDFQDMLNIALDILSEDIVANIYREKFIEIMVDEYQDTNQLQEKVIASIKKDNNVFRVGDVKQSIYKFQNAKPSLMMGLIENKTDKDLVLPLQYNYRSTTNIREFSNYIFDKLMNINENTYKKDIDDLLLDPDIKKPSSNGENIQIVHLPDKKQESGKDKALSAKEKTYNMCRYIANEICRIKNSNPECKWSDFVILLRTNKYKPTLKKALNERNVPVFTKSKTGFFSDEAISNIYSILNLVLSNSKLHAFNVLTGPMFNMSYEDVAKDKNVLDISKNQDDENSLSYFIQQLRLEKDKYSLSELLNIIYAKNNFYMEKVNSFQRSNLDSLYQLVLDYEKDDNNLKNLVAYLSTVKTVDKEEANSFNNKDNVVQIMTIHQSKGMEFKYVFLADFFNRFNEKKYNKPIQLHENQGMAMTYTTMPYKIKYPSTYYNLIKKTNQSEDFAEELRVLYVAVTRTIQKLYIVGVAKEDYLRLRVEDLYNKSMTCWIDIALEDAPGEIYNLYDVQNITLEMIDDMNESAIQDTDQKQMVDKYLDVMPAPIEEKSYSPSQLENRYMNYMSLNIQSGAKRGTLMHKAIELLGIKDIKMEDIDNLNLSLDKEDKEKILSFYNNKFTKTLHNNESYHERTFIYMNEDDELENGMIDLLSVGDKEVYVIDFKSDKDTTEEKLIKRYEDQQNAYYKVVKSYYNDKKANLLLYSFELDKYIEVPVHD